MKYIVEESMILIDFLLKETSKKRNDIKNLLKYKKSINSHMTIGNFQLLWKHLKIC